jgi:hypothetical protein
MEILAQAGMQCSVPSGFWQDLADAATEMQQPEKASKFLVRSGNSQEPV